ncbi:hypothetical protein M885DRAFT_498834 [Pelagophyceae sp. CCMP2097]|nr:hypothetical protein M885DRAFT_498834 [Pelagophyceae sp. CCMP2097]
MLPSGSPRAAGSLLRRCALATLASVFAAAQQRPRGDGAARGRGDGAGRGVRNGRPWCDAYMQENWALAGGGFLTRDPGRWHLRPDGSRAYDVEPCRVVRYTPEDARRCLKGRHLFFMGDSVTRYQTLSLMYFLENSKWPMRLPMLARRCQPKSVASKEACSKTPNICVEGDWRNGTGAVRQRDWPNMLTHTGGATGVNVTFVQQMAKGNLHGWQPTNCAESGSCRSSLAKYDLAVQKARDRDYAWSAPVYEEINNLFLNVLCNADTAWERTNPAMRGRRDDS